MFVDPAFALNIPAVAYQSFISELQQDKEVAERELAAALIETQELEEYTNACDADKNKLIMKLLREKRILATK